MAQVSVDSIRIETPQPHRQRQHLPEDRALAKTNKEDVEPRGDCCLATRYDSRFTLQARNTERQIATPNKGMETSTRKRI